MLEDLAHTILEQEGKSKLKREIITLEGRTIRMDRAFISYVPKGKKHSKANIVEKYLIKNCFDANDPIHYYSNWAEVEQEARVNEDIALILKYTNVKELFQVVKKVPNVYLPYSIDIIKYLKEKGEISDESLSVDSK